MYPITVLLGPVHLLFPLYYQHYGVGGTRPGIEESIQTGGSQGEKGSGVSDGQGHRGAESPLPGLKQSARTSNVQCPRLTMGVTRQSLKNPSFGPEQ